MPPIQVAAKVTLPLNKPLNAKLKKYLDETSKNYKPGPGVVQRPTMRDWTPSPNLTSSTQISPVAASKTKENADPKQSPDEKAKFVKLETPQRLESVQEADHEHEPPPSSPIKDVLHEEEEEEEEKLLQWATGLSVEIQTM
jgi:hypothetical protein